MRINERPFYQPAPAGIKNAYERCKEFVSAGSIEYAGVIGARGKSEGPDLGPGLLFEGAALGLVASGASHNVNGYGRRVRSAAALCRDGDGVGSG